MEDTFAKVGQRKNWAKFFCYTSLILVLANCVPDKQIEYSAIIEYMKRNDLDNAEYSIVKNVKDKAIQKNLLNYTNYLKNGEYDFISMHNQKKLDTSLYTPYKVMYWYMHGDIIKWIKKDDTLSYDYYLKALNLAEEANEILLQNEILKRLLHHFQRNPKNDDLYKYYLNRFNNQTQDEVDNFWFKYYSLSYQMNQAFLKEDLESVSEDELFLLFDYANEDSFFEAKTFQLMGIYYNVFKNNTKKAKLAFENAIKSYDKNQNFFSKKETIRSRFNKAIALKKEKKYNAAISLFKKCFLENSLQDNLKAKSLAFEHIYQSYEALGIYDSAHYYSKEKIIVDSLIRNHKLSENIHSKDYQNRLDIKETETENLSKDNQYLMIGILTALFISVFIYYKWRRSQKKKQALEVEHKQAIEEIETMKELVIKDHIILKNKARVLLEELIYIKAEDHYLALYTNSKKEFVRGRITDISKQLPPNFSRCHRSYIVNKNYIKHVNTKEIKLKNAVYIPLSRTYKSHFS